MLADRPHDHETYEDRAHRDLPLVWWVLDYTLAAIFIVVGPLYYITEAQAHPFLAQAGRTLIQVIQLGIHFAAASMFLALHFETPRSPTIRTLISVYRLIIVVGIALCLLGWWPHRFLMIRGG